MTLIGCTSAAVSAQETALLQLLPEVVRYSITAETLKLAGSDGATLLTYTAGLTGLAGTSWTATGVNNGHGGVESTAGTEHLTATFGQAGSFTGFGGCNTLSGSYAVSGTSGLTISDIASTQMACAAEVNDLETRYMAALGQVARYAIAGDQLTLRNGSGETQVTYLLAG
jgi:heat shock protein HslJ